MKGSSLFPTQASFIIFCSYIGLFVSSGLLIKAVQKSQNQGFNSIVAVLITELLKLLICIGVYLSRSGGSLKNLSHDLHRNSRLLSLYLVPAFLYCLYNNLSFINLALFDVTTYYCLMQFRTVVTAIIYQILFRRKLSHIQWLSLFVLTFGCLVKEYSLYDNLSKKQQHKFNYSILTNTTVQVEYLIKNPHDTSQSNLESLFRFVRSTFQLILQMFCSCFAGVYTEFLLKDSSTALHADVILQNMFMYFDSILCNLLVYKFSSYFNTSPSHGQEMGLVEIIYDLFTDKLTMLLILNNALSGLMASFFLKSLNSILKTFASSLELFAVAFLAWKFFGDKIDQYTIIALSLVSLALFLYSKNPVSVAPPGRVTESREGFELVSQVEE